MASPTWKISGDYFEACSCDSVCPCPTSGLAARPTQGYCDAGLVLHVERGSYGPATLDGLSFAVLLHTPGPMIAGNWTVGLIVDDKATPEQREALTAIGSGQGGGPHGRRRAARRHVCRGRGEADPDRAERHAPVGVDRRHARHRGRRHSGREPGASRSTSTTSGIPPRRALHSRRHRGATCTPSGSIGTIRRARTTATSLHFRGARVRRRRAQTAVLEGSPSPRGRPDEGRGTAVKREAAPDAGRAPSGLWTKPSRRSTARWCSQDDRRLGASLNASAMPGASHERQS